jgi:hypothetical protein
MSRSRGPRSPRVVKAKGIAHVDGNDAALSEIASPRLWKTRSTIRNGRQSTYLLTGFARCGSCGGPMRVTTGRDGRRLMRVYSCGRRKDCGDERLRDPRA